MDEHSPTLSPQSPMMCSPYATNSPENWDQNEAEQMRQYQLRISQLEQKLQQAQNEIQKLQIKVSEQQFEDKKTKVIICCSKKKKT